MLSNQINTEALRALDVGEFAFQSCKAEDLEGIRNKVYAIASRLSQEGPERKYRTTLVHRSDTENMSQIFVWRDQ